MSGSNIVIVRTQIVGQGLGTLMHLSKNLFTVPLDEWQRIQTVFSAEKRTRGIGSPYEYFLDEAVHSAVVVDIFPSAEKIALVDNTGNSSVLIEARQQLNTDFGRRTAAWIHRPF
jgi:hypothetical protein